MDYPRLSPNQGSGTAGVDILRAMSTTCLHNGAKAEQGQSLTELALLMPFLVILLLGTIDLGRAYFTYVGITNAAREGARAGMDNPTNAGDCSTSKTIRYSVCQELQSSGFTLANPSTDIAIECSALSPESYSSANCSTVATGGRIRVTVQYNFSFMTTQVIGLNSLMMKNWAAMTITNGAQPSP